MFKIIKKPEVKKDYLSFSGKIVTFNPIENHDYFGGSLTLSGKSKRMEVNYEKSCNLGFMIPKPIWNKLIAHNIGKDSEINITGHFEAWKRTKFRTDEITGEERMIEDWKTIHVADAVNF